MFDKETNRTLARTVALQQEFDPADTEILASCLPGRNGHWETKSSESDGWLEQPAPSYLIRSSCVLSLRFPLSTINYQPSTCRLTYTGGCALPGTTAQPGQTPLPDDLEQAAIEQVASCLQKRDKLGIRIAWPSGGTYQQFAAQDLLPSVQAILARYTHWNL